MTRLCRRSVLLLWLQAAAICLADVHPGLNGTKNFRLGVIVDAGRHSFPIDWLHKFLQQMHNVGFNLLHLRLTNDQSFSLPLSNSSRSSDVMYSVNDLKSIVSHARELNISIVPEIHLPGHAGAWPLDMIVPCPQYICFAGLGIDLDVSNNKVILEIERVLRQTLSIFEKPKFLHLGGYDDVYGSACRKEAKMEKSDYSDFEQSLERILNDLQYPLEQVIRWETPREAPRHHHQIGSIIQVRDAAGKRNQPFFDSGVLDFHKNGMHDGWDVYHISKKWMEMHNVDTHSRGLFVNTMALGPKGFVQRNVLGRLVAVAMGVSSLEGISSQTEFEGAYKTYCLSTLNDPSICDLLGSPKATSTDFIGSVCERVTETKKIVQMKLSSSRNTIQSTAFVNFWSNLGSELPKPSIKIDASTMNQALLLDERFLNSRFKYRGIILDMVDNPEPAMQLNKVLRQIMAPLGLNTLQLTLTNNRGFAFQSESNPGMFSFLKPRTQPLKEAAWRDIVRNATSLGIQVIPEISITTNAGGWSSTGLLVKCMKVLCSNGVGANDVSNAALLPMAITVIQDIARIFMEGSEYIHLGSDERKESLQCWDESDTGSNDVAYDQFETSLARSLGILGLYDADHILRWENSERVHYPSRAGKITHNHRSIPRPTSGDDAPPLSFGMVTISADMDPWAVYTETRKWADVAQPFGLLAKVVDMTITEDAIGLERLLIAFSMASSLDFPLFQKQEELDDRLNILCKGRCEESKRTKPIQSGPPSRTLCDVVTEEKKIRVMRTIAAATS